MQAVLAQRRRRRALTVTLSKKASTGARSSASARMAPAKFSTLMAATVSAFTFSMAAASAILLRLAQQRGIGGAGVAHLVLLLLDAEDVAGALDAGEQDGAVVGLQELGQRLDALDDQRQVVLAGEREDRVDQIVPRALVPQVHLQPVGEEGMSARQQIVQKASLNRVSVAAALQFVQLFVASQVCS